MMQTIRLYSALILCAWWLTSCSTMPASQAPQNAALSWESRAQSLANIQRWSLNGLLAIRTGNNAESASLHWQQNNEDYTLLLFGPLGSSTYNLSGRPGQVELSDPHGNKFYASTPEALLASQTGWNLPVSNLYYWIRGLPVPSMGGQKQFDKYNHLTELTQDGWKIQFLRYTATSRGDLPSKIFINSPRLNVKIIISQWQF